MNQTDRWIGWAATATAAGLAEIAGAVTYSHMRQLRTTGTMPRNRQTPTTVEVMANALTSASPCHVCDEADMAAGANDSAED